ncbi:RNA polymerase sigma-70 factor [Chitinophaga sp.]|uniref:RNA polymerase sigma-70 factor n=1 Tax=Chitinophaga sp. TaxID=1869181 RepID=UPI00260F5F9A|nr:RNA polymerase sigma-70 factor [uncultured Chitinophaga sp.]
MPDSNKHIRDLQEEIARNDSEQAFAALFRLLYDRLIRFCMQYVSSREAAEEVVSDVFVRIWERRAGLTEVGNLEVYLFVSVRNQAYNYQEKYSSMRISPLENGEWELKDTGDPGRDMEWKEMAARLDREVNLLPDQCRKVFRLIKEEGFRYKEVAQILNISPRTVETQLFRAIRRLQEAVGHWLPDKLKKGGKLPPTVGLLLMLLDGWMW